MIWLASFPRSGNTFVRNILFEVYGLKSSTYHLEKERPIDQEYHKYPFVKTHLLPDQLPPEHLDNPCVYIVRDPRDSLVSLAHHRKDIVVPGSDFESNLLEAILAQGSSFFGGWSKNVEGWLAMNPVILRYENLLVDPIAEISKIGQVIDLPEPSLEKLPTFNNLKFGDPQYGGTQSGKVGSDFSQKFFRKGISGGWISDIDKNHEDLIWAFHGKTMEKLGYTKHFKNKNIKKKRVLIDGTKFIHTKMDGITRYSRELITNIYRLTEISNEWEIDILLNSGIVPIGKLLDKPANYILKDSFVEHEYENHLLRIKYIIRKFTPLPIYSVLKNLYLKLNFRRYLTSIREFFTLRKLKELGVTGSSDLSYDLYHALYPQSILRNQLDTTLNLVTIHDLTHKFYPEYHLKDTIDKIEEALNYSMLNSCYYVSVSQNTKSDLIRTNEIVNDQIDSIYLGVHQHQSTTDIALEKSNEIRSKYKIKPGRIILCLSTIEPRKNLKKTITCFVELVSKYNMEDVQLVIAGNNGWLSEDLFADIWKHDQVTFTGYVDEVDLPHLYRMATFFCYLSHYEGFGLPLLESMSLHTPVLYGANSSMLEIVGDSGLGVDSNDNEQIVKNMKRLLDDESLRLQLSKNGLLKSMKYNWLKTAFHTLNLYERLIRENQ